VSPSDEVATTALVADLRLAEAQLSAYRSALHRRIGEATGELIARYREQPDLCLAVLPLERRRPGRGRLRTTGTTVRTAGVRSRRAGDHARVEGRRAG
jgi:hypothetical protein